MRLQDSTQSLPARIRTIQIIMFAALAVCVVRLYNLQIVHGDYYHERAINQRLRTLPIPAARGAILDRNGRVLVDSRPIYDVVLQCGGQVARTVMVDALGRIRDVVDVVEPTRDKIW